MRSASSLRRAGTLARRRLATLAQAINRSSPTAAASVRAIGRTSPTTDSCNDVDATRTPAFVPGYARSRSRAICCISTSARSADTPGFNFPIATVRKWLPRLSHSGSRASQPNDTTMSASTNNRLFRLSTPTIRHGSPSTSIIRPTALASFAKCSRENFCDRTASSGAPGASERRVRARPAAMLAPANVKISEVARCPSTRTGSSSPLTVNPSWRRAPMLSKDRAIVRQST